MYSLFFIAVTLFLFSVGLYIKRFIVPESVYKTVKTTMKIGNIEFGQRPLFLAPMEDVTDIGFRMLCKRFGAAMVLSLIHI